jgi:hypothetical protein
MSRECILVGYDKSAGHTACYCALLNTTRGRQGKSQHTNYPGRVRHCTSKSRYRHHHDSIVVLQHLTNQTCTFATCPKIASETVDLDAVSSFWLPCASTPALTAHPNPFLAVCSKHRTRKQPSASLLCTIATMRPCCEAGTQMICRYRLAIMQDAVCACAGVVAHKCLFRGWVCVWCTCRFWLRIVLGIVLGVSGGGR